MLIDRYEALFVWSFSVLRLDSLAMDLPSCEVTPSDDLDLVDCRPMPSKIWAYALQPVCPHTHVSRMPCRCGQAPLTRG